MLRKIPDSAVPFFRDGVLAARRLGLVEDAERLDDHARKRAAAMATASREDAERQFEEASRAGYRDGLERALSAWLPQFADLLADEARLKSRTRQALDRYLDRALTDAGVEAALVTRCRETAAKADDTTPEAWTLYLPDDRGALVERLSGIAPDLLQLRRGETPWLVLERGDIVIDIDPTRPAARHLAELLDADSLGHGLERRARDYAADAVRARCDGSLRDALRQHDTGDAT